MLGRIRFVPNPDSTRHYRVRKISTHWKFQINQVGSYWFSGVNQLVSGFSICRFLAEIWLDLTRVKRDSFGSMKIWPRFGRVGVRLTGVLAELE